MSMRTTFATTAAPAVALQCVGKTKKPELI